MGPIASSSFRIHPFNGLHALIPLQFGTSGRVLYGVLDPGAQPRRRLGALIVNPWGWEALRAHRTLRSLALRLGAAGHDALRFDFSGTGDSFGVLEDALLETWIEDASSALDELLALADVRAVSVIGLRLGALVAGEVAVRRPEAVQKVVLWEPPASGAEVLEWSRTVAGIESASFPMPAGFAKSLGLYGADRMAGFAGMAAVVSSRSGALALSGARAVVKVGVDPAEAPCWVEDRDHGAGRLPIGLIDKIVHWLDS